ncbi:MAG: ATP-binding cassette domain-containing protein [Novosphingobium sp.]|nr:ATP-binding cassette domain-containing protein [Novosphingobium sp.]
MSGTGFSISVRDLSLRHGNGDVVLTGAAVEVAPGTICALLGASGSGKSSLLAALGGRLAPVAGQVLIGGRPMISRSRRRVQARIGTTYQDHRLVAQATVLDNVLAGLAPHVPWWRCATGRYAPAHLTRATDLLERLGLHAALHHRRAGSLSGGQAQRVGIARALVARPSLLLADEPIASLDPQTARDVLALIAREARESGATVVCALHQPELAATFADRILTLHEGAFRAGVEQPQRSAA